MCISGAALAAFLTLIGPDQVTMEADRVIVHAATQDALWVARGEEWCTDAPQRDAATRLTKAAK
ncbi:MAG: hypothetical protein ACU0DW_04985 [Shimia sp.]